MKAIEFLNRKKDVYYIKSKLTTKGNSTYFMTRKLTSDCLSAVPEGYEVFEKYDIGTLYIRKSKKSKFSDMELGFIHKVLESNNSLQAYRIDVYGGMIKIFVAEKSEKFQGFSGFGSTHLSEQMRIILRQSKDCRDFEIQRYCYRGSIDDWITLDIGENISQLTNFYLNHLGKESFFELDML